jgi:hypothetical protein
MIFRLLRLLRDLSDVNRRMGLNGEGVAQAREASEIFGRLGDTVRQADSLVVLASLLRNTRQLDAAEEAGSRAIDLLPEKGEELWVCQAHRVLGEYIGQGRDGEGDSPFRGGAGNCLLSQNGQSNCFG